MAWAAGNLEAMGRQLPTGGLPPAVAGIGALFRAPRFAARMAGRSPVLARR